MPVRIMLTAYAPTKVTKALIDYPFAGLLVGSQGRPMGSKMVGLPVEILITPNSMIHHGLILHCFGAVHFVPEQNDRRFAPQSTNPVAILHVKSGRK